MQVENLAANQIEEGLEVKFMEDKLKEARKEYVNSVVVKTVLRDLWNPEGGLKFTKIEGNILIAKFSRKEDMERVLHKGPWRYMVQAIQVEAWSPGKTLSELFSGKIQILMQVHNLPIEYRDKKFIIRFAEKAGKVIKTMDYKANDSDEIMKYIRFLVEIDMEAPIVPGWRLDGGDQSPVRINFKYEKLQNMCFNYRRFAMK